MKSRSEVSVFWFRRDLRLNDNRGLRAALMSGHPVLPVFIFDQEILNRLCDKADARVTFIHRALKKMDGELRALGSSLFVFYGTPESSFKKILSDFNVKAVFVNRDYEPYAAARDQKIEALVTAAGGEFKSFKDQVIFETSEVTKDDGKPYTVYSPYAKKWLSKFTVADFKVEKSEAEYEAFLKSDRGGVPTLKEIGFVETEIELPDVAPPLDRNLIKNYEDTRNFPAQAGTSRLGLHLRFGTLSVRDLVKHAHVAENKTWLNELIWREFFMQILWHFPHVVKGAFRPAYDAIEFRDAPADYQKWVEGKTGYPIVDAGMRELAATGFMHNRVRMIAASFLVKHLLISWKEGEAYFAEKLLDFELSSNSGNWQWVAGSGCDAAPYFRVFSPERQQKRFDPKAEYIQKWVPEYGTSKQLEPMIDPTTARVRVLREYKKALNRAAPETARPLKKPSRSVKR